MVCRRRALKDRHLADIRFGFETSSDNLFSGAFFLRVFIVLSHKDICLWSGNITRKKYNNEPFSLLTEGGC